MASSRAVVAIPERAVLAPIAWVLGSGWQSSSAADVLTTATDQDALAVLTDGRASLALVDPVYWARDRVALRPVLRSCVRLGPEASDLLLLSAVRLDGLERVSAPPELSGGSEEAVTRTLVREYYGVESPLELSEQGRVEGEEGRIVAGAAALSAQDAPYVEPLARAWWVMSGTPWVRALPVERADAPTDTGAESLLREVGRVLAQEADSVAAALARERGGEEERWLALSRALSLSYGAEERRGLAALLAAAARLRLCPRVEEVSLPRY